MRHRKRTIKLGRTGAHRDAMLGNLVCDLIQERKITTTLAKAKAAGRIADKMVTLGKQNTLAARRRAISKLHQPLRVKILFDDIAPKFTEREGGYTRITKLGKRLSDSSEMALLEWVEEPVTKKKKKAPAAKSKSAKSSPAKAKKPAADAGESADEGAEEKAATE